MNCSAKCWSECRCRKGIVVTVEDFAITNEMIRRVGNFGISDAVFVNVAKHNQDFRFDVPAFNVTTIENLSNSNINAAVLEAQKTLLLNKEIVFSREKELAISIIGFWFSAKKIIFEWA